MRSKFVAELIGTFALVFAGCGAIMVEERFPGAVPPGAVPLVFGLIVAAMIYAVGHISGAHFNPAVTLAFMVGRHFPKREVVPYWVAQFFGGFLAILLLSLLLPAGKGFGATVPQVIGWKALLWEVILSFFLMFVIISVATDTRAEGVMAGAAIGATVTLCALFGGPVSGASMNPARTVAPNLFQGEAASLWIYLAGPMLGTVLAAVVYEKIRCGVDSEGSGAKGCC